MPRILESVRQVLKVLPNEEIDSMKLKSLLQQSLGVAALALLASVPATVLAQSGPIIKIDGSSTVFPITEAVAEDFQKAKKNAVRVTVGISGTGGGFKKFCR